MIGDVLKLRAVLALAAGLATGAACNFNPMGTCTTAAQCFPGQTCTSGVCVGCQSSSECQAWESCNSRRCQVLPGRCAGDYNCPSYLQCNATNECVLRPGHCVGAGDCQAWEACSANVCVNQAGRCSDSTDCQSWEECDPTHTCVDAPFPEGSVLLWGTLSEGACYLDAVAPVTTPEKFRVGFECGASTDNARVGPSGQIIYSSTYSGATIPGLYRFHADTLNWDGVVGYWRYPANPQGNDTLIVQDSACAGALSYSGFVVQAGTGAVNYSCYHLGAGDDWFDEAGKLVLSDFDATAWTAGGLRLGRTGAGFWWDAPEVSDAAGNRATVTGLPGYTWAPVVRTHGESFWLAFTNQAATGLELWDVNGATRVAVKVGDFSSHPTFGWGGVGAAVLDGAGDYYFIHWSGGPTGDVVVRLPLKPAAAELVYTESAAPTSANDWNSRYFNGYVKIHISSLVTQP